MNLNTTQFGTLFGEQPTDPNDTVEKDKQQVASAVGGHGGGGVPNLGDAGGAAESGMAETASAAAGAVEEAVAAVAVV